MSKQSHTPGPWQVKCLSKPQLRPYYAVRPCGPHWDQLRAIDGGIASFETKEEAEAAIANATGDQS
jgi:hypothetical protein